MLRYPAWFSTLHEGRMEDVLQREEAPWTDGLGTFDGFFPSDQKALQALLNVFQEFVDIVEEEPRADARSDAERFLTHDLIGWIDRHRPTASDLTRKAFAQAVHDELATCPQWQAFLETHPPAKRSGPRSRKLKTDVVRLRAERERVVLPWLEEVGWTPTRWAKEAGGLDPHVVLGYLAGTSTPRRPYKTRLTYTLAKALNRTKLLLPD